MKTVQELARARFIGAKNKAQGEALEQQMNALCFVLVSFGDVFALVPWDDWKQMGNKFGHKYMTRQEAAPYRVRYNTRGILDFLGWERMKK